MSEVDGQVKFGKVKRGNREITIVPKFGDPKKYIWRTITSKCLSLIFTPCMRYTSCTSFTTLSKQILVQENDVVRAGTALSDGAITPADILA